MKHLQRIVDDIKHGENVDLYINQPTIPILPNCTTPGFYGIINFLFRFIIYMYNRGFNPLFRIA